MHVIIGNDINLQTGTLSFVDEPKCLKSHWGSSSFYELGRTCSYIIINLIGCIDFKIIEVL